MADPDALARYKQAKKALYLLQVEEEAAGIEHETLEYLRLNRAVNELAEQIPWWRR
jgi:hypothetical protein